VLQALSGMMTAQGGDSDPVLFTIPVNDIAAATLAVLGVCLAVFHRLRHGVGQKVYTSLLACSTMMQSGELVRVAGRTPNVRGGRDFAGPAALDRFYRLQDGWLRLQAPDASALHRAGLLGGVAADAPAAAPADTAGSRPADPATGESVGAAEAVPADASDDALAAALADELASRPLAQTLACLRAAGVPAAPARLPADLTVDPDLCDLELFATRPMRDGTPFYVANRFARFSRTQTNAVLDPPGLGEHTRQVLAEAGVSPTQIDALVNSGGAIQGEPFRVVAIQTYR
jgi:crotonobetainyl-CoA:carnitine CoA-transferase CaiB-like acyl-CoA transferase